MITVKIDKKYNIPTSWNDITCGKFRDWLLLDTEGEEIEVYFRRLSFMSGVPVEVLERCDTATIEIISTAVNFMFHVELLEAFNIYDKEYDSIEVGKMPAKTILQVQGALGKAKKLKPDDGVITYLIAGNEIVEAYTGRDIKDEPITMWYGLMCFFLSKSIAFSLNTAFSMLTKVQEMS